jgi:hypothetical protein
MIVNGTSEVTQFLLKLEHHASLTQAAALKTLEKLRIHESCSEGRTLPCSAACKPPEQVILSPISAGVAKEACQKKALPPGLVLQPRGNG